MWLIATPDALPTFEHGVAAAKTTLRWILDGGMQHVPAESVRICVQRRGELIYLPRWYMHATLNLGDAVGMGVQRSNLVTHAQAHSLADLKVQASLQPTHRQMYQAVLTRLQREQGLAPQVV